jgi:thermitase
MKLSSVQQLAEHLCQSPLLLGLLGLTLLIVPLASFAAGAEAPMVQAEPGAKPGEILVKFEADVSSLAIETTNQSLGTSVIEMIPQLNVYRLRIPQDNTIAGMIELFQHTPGVAYAEPNYFVYALETRPDDGRFGDQWALGAIEAPAAWDITTGTNDILIAIIDTGIDYTHPDLDGGRYVVDGYDFVNEDDDPMDDEGHGTHVTGIATADTNNGQGIAGLAWNSRFMGVKVLDAEGVGTDFDVADGIMYAADHGAHVANLSLGSPFHSHTLEDAMQYAYTEGRDQKGMVMACAVGNSYGSGVSYPAAYDQCLGVAATDRSDERAIFSSYGPEVDVAAPGVDILSTTGGDYESWGGTSMATPHVTGLAALILAQDPELPVDQVFAAIRDSADDVNAETHPGKDDYLGTGRINAYRALTALVRIEPPDTMADLSSSFTVTVVIKDITDLGSFRFDVTYDPSVVTVDSVVLGDFLGSTGRDVSEIGPEIDNEGGVTSYEADSSGTDLGANGTGVLATITFNAVGLGSSVLHLENVSVTRASGSAIPVAIQDGNVTVAEAFVTIEPPETTVIIGSSFAVTVSIRDVADLGSFQFDLTYVSSTMTATHAVCGPFPGSTGRSVIPVGPTMDNIVGRVTFGCSSEGGEPGPDGTGELATITFNAVDLGVSPLQFENVQVTDTADVAIAVGAQDGNVTVTAACREDVNGDGAINVVDIQLVAARWNTAEGDPGYDSFYDINEDGRINIVDIQRVAAKWNTTC